MHTVSTADLTLSVGLTFFTLAVAIWLSRHWAVSVVPSAMLTPYMFAGAFVFSSPESPLFVASDGDYYLKWGHALAADWKAGEAFSIADLWPGRGLLPAIIGVLSSIFGPLHLAIVSLNILVTVLVVLLSQRSATLFGTKFPVWSGITVFLFTPGFILFGPSTLREPIFWLGIALGVAALGLTLRKRKKLAVTYLCLSVFTLLGIRPDLGVLISYAFVVSVIAATGSSTNKGRKRVWAIKIAAFAIISALLPFAFDAVRPGVNAQTILSAQSDLSNPEVESRINPLFEVAHISGYSAPEATVNSESRNLELVARTALNFPATLLGPFPWEYRSEPIWLIAGFASFSFVTSALLAVYALRGQPKGVRSLILLFSIALFTLVVYSSILGNYGILMRFKTGTAVLFFPLVPAGLAKLRATIIRLG